MTTPTQAQREAATRAIRAVLHKDHRGAKGADALAEAALTAAAEVGQQKQSSIGPHYLPPLELDDATIERCAQVADRWKQPLLADAIRALKDKP